MKSTMAWLVVDQITIRDWLEVVASLTTLALPTADWLITPTPTSKSTSEPAASIARRRSRPGMRIIALAAATGSTSPQAANDPLISIPTETTRAAPAAIAITAERR